MVTSPGETLIIIVENLAVVERFALVMLTRFRPEPIDLVRVVILVQDLLGVHLILIFHRVFIQLDVVLFVIL